MPGLGEIVGPYEGLVTAIADTLYEMSGNLIVRTRAAYTAGAPTIFVESTDRFPTTGRFAVRGMVGYWTGKTSTALTGITDVDGNPGLPDDVPSSSVLMDVSRTETQLQDLRASFVLSTCEDIELDILARNYGWFRPRGLTDTKFRDFLQAAIYLEAQTIYGIEQVLDAVVGPGNYTVWEDLESFPHTVFLRLTPQPGGPEGRTYVVSLEGPHARATPTTVVADNPPEVVYGVWADNDPFRLGTNYAQLGIPATTNSGQPERISSAAAFLPTDINRPVTLVRASGVIEAWRVRQFVNPSTVRLATPIKATALLNNAQPNRVHGATGTFPTWCVGHKIEIISDNPANAGTYVIASRISSREIVVSGAAFDSEVNVQWRLVPVFPTEAGLTARLLRATVAGTTITTPVAMPINVLLDYTTVQSAQAMQNESTNGNPADPFYLWSEGAVALTLLDLITAAGVRVVLVE